MAKILESFPNNFATGVVLNVFLSFKFDEALDRSTITDSSVILVQTDTEEIVSGVPDYVVGTKTLTFQLYAYLEKNTKYSIILVGGDSGIKTLLGENWDDNSFVSYFTTGETVDKTIPLAQVGDAATDGPYFTGEDGIYAETFGRTGEPVSHIVTTAAEVGIDGTITPIPQGPDQYIFPPDAPIVFEVASTSPINGETNVITSEIKVVFNLEPDPDSLVNRVLITGEDLLGFPVDSETYINSVSEKTLTIAPSGVLADEYAPSSIYNVVLKSGITDISASGVLSSDYLFTFKTAISPYYSTVKLIRSNLGDLIRKVKDSEIEMLIYENSSYILSVATTAWEDDAVPQAARDYVECKTKLDLIHRVYFAGGPVTSKTLDDFTVSYGRGFVDIVKKRIEGLNICVTKNLNIITTGQSFVSSVGTVKADYDERRPTWERLEDEYFSKDNSVDVL